MKSAFVDLWSQQRLSGLNQKLPALVTYDGFSFLKKAIVEIARTYRGGLSYVSVFICHRECRMAATS